MGDFNAQIRKDKNGYENIMETHEEGERNTERDSLLHMCNRYGWVTGNRWSQKRSHKTTYYSWDGKFWTITDDFIMTRNI
jgi:hypothetical protein